MTCLNEKEYAASTKVLLHSFQSCPVARRYIFINIIYIVFLAGSRGGEGVKTNLNFSGAGGG